MGMEGLEPTLSEENRILSPVRLPFRHMPKTKEFIIFELEGIWRERQRRKRLEMEFYAVLKKVPGLT